MTDRMGAAEAAEILGVDKSTITRWALSGKLPYTKALPGKNGPYMFDPADIQRVKNTRTTEKQSA